LQKKIAWLKANYIVHIPLCVYCRSIPLVIHTIDLLLNKFVTIYNTFVNIYRIEDSWNKPNILSILIKIKYTQYIVEILTTILHLPTQAYRLLKLLYTYPSIHLHIEEFATILCTGDGRRSNYCIIQLCTTWWLVSEGRNM